MRVRDLTLLVVWTTPALIACGTVTSYQTAEPVLHWRVSAALTGGVYRDTPQDSRTPLAQGELEVRRGVARDVDVGVKVYTVGGELNARWRIVDARWSWAVLGGFGGVRNDDRSLAADGLLLHGRIGAVATRRTSPRWAFSIGPSLTVSRYWFDGGGDARGALLGVIGNAEYRFRTRWRVVPELGMHATLVGEVPVDGAVLHLGVAIARDL